MVSKKGKIIILYSENWEEGILGLIASKMVEKFYRPTIVMTKSDGYAKASVRSIIGFDVTKFLRGLKEYLISVGGHAAAAGFSIEEDQIKPFTEAALKKAEEEIDESLLVRSMNVDLELPLSLAKVELCNSLQLMQPFGIGNPQPVFYSKAQVIEAKLLGSTGKHLKMYVKQENSLPVEFVFFNKGDMFSKLSPGQTVDVVYTLDIDRWGGRERVVGKGKYIEINGD
jgi:single-stranded-DNA-specific exonuclease